MTKTNLLNMPLLFNVKTVKSLDDTNVVSKYVE